jgi:hypothetical protein
LCCVVYNLLGTREELKTKQNSTFHKEMDKLTFLAGLVIAPYALSLKLTPVQQSAQRVDLANESRSTAIALNNALYKIEQGEIPLYDPQLILNAPEIQRLHAVVRRWTYMEDRLRTAISPGSSQQV